MSPGLAWGPRVHPLGFDPEPLREPFQFLLALQGLTVLADAVPGHHNEPLRVVDLDRRTHLPGLAPSPFGFLAFSYDVSTRTRARQLGIGAHRVDNLSGSFANLPRFGVYNTVQVHNEERVVFGED